VAEILALAGFEDIDFEPTVLSHRKQRSDIVAVDKRVGSDPMTYHFDVTVVHPTAVSRVRGRKSVPKNTAVFIAEDDKRRLYRTVAEQPGVKFVPLGLEVFGLIGPCFQGFLKECANRVLDGANLVLSDKDRAMKRGAMVQCWGQTISCILQRMNCFALGTFDEDYQYVKSGKSKARFKKLISQRQKNFVGRFVRGNNIMRL
jgi:hypothetical protein